MLYKSSFIFHVLLFYRQTSRDKNKNLSILFMCGSLQEENSFDFKKVRTHLSEKVVNAVLVVIVFCITLTTSSLRYHLLCSIKVLSGRVCVQPDSKPRDVWMLLSIIYRDCSLSLSRTSLSLGKLASGHRRLALVTKVEKRRLARFEML